MPAVHACLTRQRLQALLSPCNWPDRSPNPSHTQPRPHAHIRRHMHAPTPPKTYPYLLQLPWSRACALPSARAAAPWVPAWWLRSSSEARPFNQLAGAQAERGREAEPATPAPPPCPCHGCFPPWRPLLLHPRVLCSALLAAFPFAAGSALVAPPRRRRSGRSGTARAPRGCQTCLALVFVSCSSFQTTSPPRSAGILPCPYRAPSLPACAPNEPLLLHGFDA